MKKALTIFFHKYFVKWKFLNSLLVIPFSKDGKKYLHISQVCADGRKVVKRTFLIEHLVNENYEITDQTLKEEERVFTNPIEF
jgi:hypothetical protein